MAGDSGSYSASVSFKFPAISSTYLGGLGYDEDWFGNVARHGQAYFIIIIVVVITIAIIISSLILVWYFCFYRYHRCSYYCYYYHFSIISSFVLSFNNIINYND